MKQVTSRRVQCDEIWSFVYSKQKNAPAEMEGAGDVWTFVGIDADTKLVISWLVGQRDMKQQKHLCRMLQIGYLHEFN